jgi:hypothetical protein
MIWAPGLMFLGRASSLPISWSPTHSCRFDPYNKYYTRVEVAESNKCASLFYCGNNMQIVAVTAVIITTVIFYRSNPWASAILGPVL